MPRAFVIILLILSARLHSQIPGASTFLTVNEGLSQGLVYDMLQSRDGFIWIATKAGLNRYDGARVKIYSHDPFDPFSLASNDVLGLFEDSRGWLWLRLPDGMDVFVPELQRFFHLPAIGKTGLDVASLSFAELADGTVLFMDNGIFWKIGVPAGIMEAASAAGNAFPKLACEPIQLQPPAGWGLKEVRCYHFFLTRDKILLISSNDGLFRLDPDTGKLRSEGLKGNVASILGEDRTGQVWMVTMLKTPSVVGYPSIKTVDGYYLPIQAVVNKLEAVKVWDSAAGVHQKTFHPTTSSPHPDGASFPHTLPPIQSFTKFDLYRMDDDGFLWTLTTRKLRKWELEVWSRGGKPELELNASFPLAKDSSNFSNLHFDRSGNIWLGTSGYGAIKINPSRPKFNKYYLRDIPSRSFLEDPQGNLLALQDGLKIYDGKHFDRTWPNPWFGNRPYLQEPYPAVFDKAGNCWINSLSTQLKRVDARTKTERAFPWPGFGLIISKSGKLLSAGEQGLMQFDPVTEQSKVYPFGQPLKIKPGIFYSHYLYEDSMGVVWVFLVEGLLKATPTGSGYQFEHFANNPADRSTLSNNNVLSVAEDPLDPQRYLWIGTDGGGLNRLDRQSGKFQQYKKEQGLPDNVVYGILPSNDGHIWLSTNRGLCRFHVRTESTQNFTMADGLSDNEFNQTSYLKMRDGRLIFGGVNGITVFHPDSLRFNRHLPQMQIVGMKANNKDVGLPPPHNQQPATHNQQPPPKGQAITLSHNQNLITLDFAALEFSNPSKNLYRYRLTHNSFFGNPGEEAWVDLGSVNTMQFAQLPPGSYTFEVLGCNNDGIWAEQPAVLRFIIRSPWWATWLAYLLYALVVGGLGWLFYRYQIRLNLQEKEALHLQEIDHFKNRLFTNITHEFRTPLTVIMGMAEQLGRDGEDWSKDNKLSSERITEGLLSKIQDRTGLILRNAGTLLRLVNQMLDLSKLDSGKMSLQLELGDVVLPLQYLSESFHSYAATKQIHFTFYPEVKSLEMDFDREKLQQIISNLLTNAFKFTPKGGKVVFHVSQVAASPDSTQFMLQLKISDTGTGMAAEHINNVFDRFYQVDDTHTRTGEGTGIGLALTKDLVELMDGRISVESELGKGSTFLVLLPVQQTAARSIDSLQIETAVPAYETRTPEPMTSIIETDVLDTDDTPMLLLIEDNADVATYIRTCLESQYKVLWAENGQLGIDKALETIPDLIISDVMMPEKDGYEVTQFLKNDERTSHIPIVLLTAKVGVESRIAGLRRGADAYLSKPFHPEELLVRLSSLLELRKKLQKKYGNLGMEKLQTPQTPSEVPDNQSPSTQFTNYSRESSISPIPQSPAPDLEDAFLLKIITHLEKHFDDADFGVPQLSHKMGLSQSQLYRKIKALTDLSTAAFIRRIRLQKGKELLETTGLTMSEIAYQVGFTTPNYFSDAFLEEFGTRPNAMRN